MANKKYTFYSPQFVEYQKSIGWYTNIGIIGLVLVLFFVFFMHRYLAAVVVVLCVIVLFKYANIKPKKQQITLSDEIIKVGKKEYRYDKIVGFWFIQTDYGLFLYIKTKKRFKPNIAIQVDNKDIEQIRSILAQHLPELPSEGEDTFDRIARILKF